MLRQHLEAPLRTLVQGPKSLAVLAGAGLIQPFGPATLGRIAYTVVRWGAGPAGGYQSLAARYPDEIGVIDERGTLKIGRAHV